MISKKHQNKKKYKKIQIFIACILIIYLFSIITILGRYAINGINDFFTKTKEFYFYSDKLSDKNPKYQIDNWSGVNDYVITVNMNSRKNNLLAAAYDIGYEITYTASSNIICQLSKTEGTINSKTNTDYFNLTITPNTQLKSGDKVFVEIVAKATKPYEKEIKADFTLVIGKENLTYEIVDEKDTPYLKLNITNTQSYYIVNTEFGQYKKNDKISGETYLNLSDVDKQKCYSTEVTLKFDPREVILDMTNSAYLRATNITNTAINGYNYTNGITFKIEALSSECLRFYKKDQSKDYTYPIINSKSIIELTNR